MIGEKFSIPKFLVALALFLIVSFLPELVGGDLADKLKNLFGTNYYVVVIGVGLVGTIIYLILSEKEKFVKEKSTSSTNNELSKFNSDHQSFIDRRNKLAQTYGASSGNKESWFKRVFGIETLSAILLIDRFRKWIKDDSTNEIRPSSEYDTSELPSDPAGNSFPEADEVITQLGKSESPEGDGDEDYGGDDDNDESLLDMFLNS